VISPILANVFLHYVLDLWTDHWRRKEASGEMMIARYADDFVIGFRYQRDARRFLQELHSRMEKFGLTLHPEKTRLVEFGPYARENCERRAQGKPETFDFLGFTHYCSQSHLGTFPVKRCSIKKRLRATLQAIKVKLRKRMHLPISEQGQWLQSVVRGWLQYHAVPFNRKALETFHRRVARMWRHVLRRRSQKGRQRWTWQRMYQLIDRWFPPVQILHPHPSERLIVGPKVGAVCGNAARTDPRGGRPERAVPTATMAGALKMRADALAREWAGLALVYACLRASGSSAPDVSPLASTCAQG
jgi:hypothetical protein